MPNLQPPRLIENWLPINQISAECIRERNAASALPPVNWLHVWWARRPLAISRAAVAGSLLDADAPDAMARFYDLMGTHPGVADEQRRLDQAKITGETLKVAYSMPRAFTHNLTPEQREWFQDNLAVPDPVVLDVTAGGGSIPFEAGRLGLRTIANELNPVAALILRATCQWPQQHGPALVAEYQAVKDRFLQRVRQLIDDNAVYPPEPDFPQPGAEAGEHPENKNFANRTVRLHKYAQTYLWSRTVRCPDCRGLIPLSPNWRLDGNGKGIRLRPTLDDQGQGICEFDIVDTARQHSSGTVARGKAVCPYPGCGATTAAGYIAAEAQAGRLGEQLYCVIIKNQWRKLDKGEWVNIRRPKEYAHIPNREFRSVRDNGADDNSSDITALLDANRERWDAENVLPNEPKPPGDDDRPITYRMSPWRNMFSRRQRLAYGHCVQAFRDLVDADRDAGRMTDARRAAYCYVALALNKLISTNSYLCRWHTNRGVVAGTFDRHDFGMKWSYSEMALSVTGLGLEWALNDVGDCIKEMTVMAGHFITGDDDKSTLLTATPETANVAPPSAVACGDARMLDLDDGSVDAIVFDPPYHNNVNYAELSDFFYVWLKRTAGYVLGDADSAGLFADHLTDKVNEAIASPARFKAQAAAANVGKRGKDKVTAAALATEDYQRKMDEIFRECRRVLKPDAGIMTVMFTHKSNAAWNAMTIGLIEAGFNITRAWPVKTEAESSLHIRDKAAARSTILLVCRPAGERRPQPWPSVAQEIARAVRDDVANLRAGGLNTVDIYTASYGTALKVVSENWGAKRETANPDRPEDPFGVLPEDALEVARQEVIAFRSEQIAAGAAQNLTNPLTWFYILAQDGAGGATMPFDEANLFARALGVELSGNDAKRILSSKSGKVTLKAAVERWNERIISADRAAATPLDQAHTAIAIADRQDAAAAKQWLEFNGHRWQDGEFKTTFEALRQIHKPGHPDEAGARALYALLYEAEAPRQERLLGTVAVSE